MADHPDDGVLFDLGGGKTLRVPPLVLYTLEKAWPAIDRLRNDTTKIGEANTCVDIVIEALSETEGAPTRDGLRKMVRTTHMGEFVNSTIKLLDISGLLPKGEAKAGAEVVAAAPAGPSPATAPASLPSSSVTE